LFIITNMPVDDNNKTLHAIVLRHNMLYLNIGNTLSKRNKIIIIAPIKHRILNPNFISFNKKNSFQFGRFIYSPFSILIFLPQ